MDSNGQLKAVELFAGGGGMALGTHLAGYKHSALLEIDPDAVATLKKNVAGKVLPEPGLPLRATDIKTFRWEDHQDTFKSVDLLAGGAPCQPFSLGGVHRGNHDHRNLFPEVFRAQRSLLPKALLLENVRGLARPSFRPYLEYILLQLALPGVPPRSENEDWQDHRSRLLETLDGDDAGDAPGYDVWIAAIDCANFGIPQRRNRVFMVAFRADLGVDWTWPVHTHSEHSLLHAQLVSGEYWKEHQLPSRKKDYNPSVAQIVVNGTRRWRTVRDALRDLPDPTSNGSRKVHPNHILIPGARAYTGHTGSPLDEPAKTLKAGVHGVPGGENMLQDDDGRVRYFTVHESALLQTFPESYVFHGSRTTAMRQIGNAAPVAMVRLLAERISVALKEPSRNGRQVTPHHVDLVGGTKLTVL